MSDNLNNNFEEIIRNKIQDYRTDVDSSTWDSIEKTMLKQKRTKYLYVVSGAVAAAVVLLFLIRPAQNNIVPPENGVQTAETQNPVDKENNPVIVGKEESTSGNVVEPVENIENSATQQMYAVAKNASIPNKNIVADLNQYKNIDISVAAPKVQINPPTMLALRETNKSQPNYYESPEPTPKLSKNNNWVASAGFGTGNYQQPDAEYSNIATAVPMMALDNSGEYIRNQFRNEIGVPETAEPQHGIPLSFRLTVRKNLNAKWAVETGVSYTYLSTKYKWNGGSATQQLHYIGIPINVSYNILSKPNWKFYVSAGGMAEKGVYGQIKHSDSKSDINLSGLQWSVNGALGVAHKVFNNVDFFLEPQFGYFFKSNQPENIRTEWPVSVGVGGGFRFNF